MSQSCIQGFIDICSRKKDLCLYRLMINVSGSQIPQGFLNAICYTVDADIIFSFMITISKNHPFFFSLQQMSLIIDNLPKLLPQDMVDSWIAELQKHGDAHTMTSGEVDGTLYKIAYTAWPYRKAWEELFARYGKPQVQECLRNELGKEQWAKLEELQYFESDLYARLESAYKEFLKHKNFFKEKFTPEEYLFFENVLFSCMRKIRANLTEKIKGELAPLYEEARKKYEESRKEYDARLEKLGELARRYPRFAPEIKDVTGLIREGMSVISLDFTLQDIDKRIEDIRGRAGENI